MKKGQILLFVISMILIVGMFSACEPEPVDIESPSISLVAADGYISKDTILQKGQEFKVKVIATAGTNDIKLLAINENDVKISLDRIISGVNANPALVLGADAQGFEKEIGIMAQEEGLSKYTIYVEDVDGYTNGVSFTVTEVFNSLDNEVGDLKVYNFSGPNFGSLDLQVPEVVSSSDPNGDIQDLGIDTNLPVATNWLKKIKAKNGAELFEPAEGLIYDDVNSKESLKAAVEAGTMKLVSDVLTVGSLYLVKTPSLEGTTSDYFLLRVDDIVVTSDNNQDYYLFTLKQALNM